MPLLFLLIAASLLLPASAAPHYPYNTSYHIDCGGHDPSTDVFNVTWIPDQFFTGGEAAPVSEPLHFIRKPEKNLRYFPLSFGKKNCYTVPLPSGRYYIRTFTVYDNYDGKSQSPSFDASVEGTLVFSWRSPWPEPIHVDGAYSDLFAFVKDGELDFCFYSIATDPPVIGALEIVQIDPLSYDSARTGDNYILVNYGRVSAGSAQWGPGFTPDADPFCRSWQPDTEFRNMISQSVRTITTKEKISGADQAPNYFPVKLYQSAVTKLGDLEYELSVDAKLDYLLWFHFAEIDSTVKKAGERVFDLLVNEVNVSRVDIYKEVGNFAAFSLNYTVRNLSGSVLSVKLLPVVGALLLSGFENYAMVPADMSTALEQADAMRALKESFSVPARMGWNGDPCAPTNWDAWEGVTCHPNQNNTALVITQIDLGSQGLKGFISDKISLLSNLVHLNLSSNSLTGALPAGLGQKTLKRLDLANNQFSGPIPESLSSSGLQLVLLNGNRLEGRVSEELYSVGMHGGAIDLSGNKGLCGVPSLPDCPLLWENGHLSKGGIIGIALSCIFLLAAAVAIYIICMRRRRYDYDFSLPRDLMSLAAKRNKYQRQKSLMHLEMESNHAKGLPSIPLNSH